MGSVQDERPWEQLERLAEQSDPVQVEAFLDALPPGEAARALSRLPSDNQERVLEALTPEDAADLVDRIPDAQAADLIEHLQPNVAAAIVQELPSDEQADLLGDLDAENAEAILTAMEPEQAQEARALTRYADDVAGGLMITEYLSFADDAKVVDVIDDLRANADEYRYYDVQYAYVIDGAGKLTGVLRLRDLLLARRTEMVRDIAIREPVTILNTAALDEVRDVFDRHPFFGMPVLNESGVLVGIIQRSAVEEALAERTESDYRKSQGIVGGEELRTMPLFLRSRRRLAWLSVNIVLNVIAASVIAFYQETLASVIALAVFLPIISDMSGCSGNQAVAVSMRELTLGLVRHTDVVRVWLKEISVGMMNGVALGLLIASVAWIWKGNPFLGLVVGAAMTLNTLVAVSIGGAVPLVLRRLRVDPALASGPVLTTITDMCGFFLILSLATAMLPWLTQ